MKKTPAQLLRMSLVVVVVVVVVVVIAVIVLTVVLKVVVVVILIVVVMTVVVAVVVVIVVVVAVVVMVVVGLFRFRIWLLKLTNLLWRFGRTPSKGNQPDARSLPTQDSTTQKNGDTHIHATSGTRNRGPSVRAVEDSMSLRPCDYWNLKSD